MNRREVLTSIAAVAGAPLSVTVATDKSGLAKVSAAAESSPMIIHHWQRPLIVAHTARRLTTVNCEQIRRDLDSEGDRHGCSIVFVPDCDGITVPGASNAKYGFTEKLGDYSLSVFCQTADELREWMTK